jgi:hypothetical protein
MSSFPNDLSRRTENISFSSFLLAYEIFHFCFDIGFFLVCISVENWAYMLCRPIYIPFVCRLQITGPTASCHSTLQSLSHTPVTLTLFAPVLETLGRLLTSQHITCRCSQNNDTCAAWQGIAVRALTIAVTLPNICVHSSCFEYAVPYCEK